MSAFDHCRLLLPALLTAVLAAPASRAGEAPKLVQAMLENAPAAAESRCSYTRTRTRDGETRQERYHAGDRESSWVLQKVDGREPSAGELRDYARDAEDRDRRHPLAFDLRDMVDPEHWRLRTETGDEAVFEFRLRPGEDLDERLVDKVQGILVVDKRRRQPMRIRIENTEAAYVAPLVRVAEYVQEMQFHWNEAVGASVLTRSETRWRGRALGLKVIREHRLTRYSDYQCRSDMAGAPE